MIVKMMMMLQTPRMISDVATRTGPAAGGQLERDIEQVSILISFIILYIDFLLD